MLYKVAAIAKIAKENSEERRAINNAATHIAGAALPIIGAHIAGYYEGKKFNHPVVGALYGPMGVNGARAKDTGISTFGPTVRQAAKWGAISGGTLGALAIGALAAKERGRPLAGAIAGTLWGSAAGAISGAGLGALAYGLGYHFGKKQKIKKLKNKKKI